MRTALYASKGAMLPCVMLVPVMHLIKARVPQRAGTLDHTSHWFGRLERASNIRVSIPKRSKFSVHPGMGAHLLRAHWAVNATRKVRR